MKITMTTKEIVAAFNGSSKVCNAVLSYYGVNSGDVEKVTIDEEDCGRCDARRDIDPETEEKPVLNQLTKDCIYILANHIAKRPGGNSQHIMCIKKIRDAFPGASLIDCKSRYDHWRETAYKGNV